MTLKNAMRYIPSTELVTVSDWATADIYIDRETAATIGWGSQYKQHMAKEVLSMSVGRDYHDMIILVRA